MLSGVNLGDRYPRTTFLRWLCWPSLTRTHAGNALFASADRRANDLCDVSGPPHLHACCLSSLRLSESSISAGRAISRALILITCCGGLAMTGIAAPPRRSGPAPMRIVRRMSWPLASPVDLSAYHGMYLSPVIPRRSRG